MLIELITHSCVPLPGAGRRGAGLGPSGCGCLLAAPPESSGEVSCSSSSSAGEEGEMRKAKPGPESCQICAAEDGAQGSAASSRGLLL